MANRNTILESYINEELVLLDLIKLESGRGIEILYSSNYLSILEAILLTKYTELSGIEIEIKTVRRYTKMKIKPIHLRRCKLKKKKILKVDYVIV